jgi:hypothetical protein
MIFPEQCDNGHWKKGHLEGSKDVEFEDVMLKIFHRSRPLQASSGMTFMNIVDFLKYQENRLGNSNSVEMAIKHQELLEKRENFSISYSYTKYGPNAKSKIFILNSIE